MPSIIKQMNIIIQDAIDSNETPPEWAVTLRDNNQRALTTFNALTSGAVITVDELEHFTHHVPINLRVSRSDQQGAAGSYIPTRTDSNAESSYKSMDGAVRESIIAKWLQNGKKLHTGVHNNQLTGVTANWSHIGQGQLNVDSRAVENGFSQLDNLQGVTMENMELYAIQEDVAKSMAYDKFGNIVPVAFDTENKKGMVVLIVPTNNGKNFPLVLEQKELAGSKELGIIMAIYDDLLAPGGDLKAPIGKKVEGLLKEIPLLYKAFGKEITYGDLYSTILYPGKEATQTRVEVYPKRGVLKVGDVEYTVAEYNENRATIEKIIGFKYHRTGFNNPGSDNNMLTAANPAYLKYLVEDKILRTNVKENEDLFVSVPVENSKHRTGMGAYLNAGSIKVSDTAPEVTPPKGKPAGKKVMLNNTVRAKLTSAGVNVKALSNERIEQLNALFATTKFAGPAATEFSNIIQELKQEANDNKPNKC
jgi:hypothetical protein